MLEESSNNERYEYTELTDKIIEIEDTVTWLEKRLVVIAAHVDYKYNDKSSKYQESKDSFKAKFGK